MVILLKKSSLSSVVGAYRRNGTPIFVMVILICIMALGNGCAASKCDCPKFGGHHLKH